ncbi:ferrous iron transport protein B [Humidesulfovibrio mexicanus]|uniref:Ferrous iron transport protein B n=1 Tax=Humidesulfovibrio mexicanus TaxID=147047 RepID=A0A238Z3H6_9BACT|nr:ferrous iron transport protein B [Humidesulfovibrio mexicanus]SNR77926.1 ferrous iron transport protein B [Humidesulfovibrio mexicanus]
MSPTRTLVALAGQPNCGKSTIFNMLTGARQHVANYPGVTVEKKSGGFRARNLAVELVDLPGTYSLSSYSLEERVARDFLLHDKPGAIIDIADASNLRRSLYLTLQLLEMGRPLVLVLNMMDVAVRRGVHVDVDCLSERLGVPVIPAVGKKGQGAEEIAAALEQCVNSTPGAYRTPYGALEPSLEALERALAQEPKLLSHCPPRWLAIKLLEGDAGAEALLRAHHQDACGVLAHALELGRRFQAECGHAAAGHIAQARHSAAAELARQTTRQVPMQGRHLTERVDAVVCHRSLGPLVLMAILFLLYQASIVFGGWVSAQAWPIWGALEGLAAQLLPPPGFLEDPLPRALGIWAVKSVTAILNYLPIFFILFALIAVLEDSGYMPRMAFILDRVFHRFGLHGQSTLPLILGGVYVGGCAVPAVMATKAIPDERARLATILITPMMNCLAKVPLYLILIDAYFPEHAGAALFFIATVTVFMALPVAKALTLTVLRGKEQAPFIMEMPPYHLPTIQGVLLRATERVLIFAKKIVTVVLAVAVVVFMLISYPGLEPEDTAHFEAQARETMRSFLNEADKTAYAGRLRMEDVAGLALFSEALRDAGRGASETARAAIGADFQQRNPLYYDIVRGDSGDAKRLARSLRKVESTRKRLRREMRTLGFETSFLGMAGKALEPVTQFAGFNWRVNIALLSAFAAKENSASTLGALYGQDTDSTVESDMRAGEPGMTPLHALALMLFMALYPPCIPASVMVRLQAGSTGWMLFSMGYQTLLGLLVASLVFTGGTLLGFTGWQSMWAFYVVCVLATVAMALVPERSLRCKRLSMPPITTTCKGEHP